MTILKIPLKNVKSPDLSFVTGLSSENRDFDNSIPKKRKYWCTHFTDRLYIILFLLELSMEILFEIH